MRRNRTLWILGALLLLAVAASTAAGSVPLPLGRTVRILLHAAGLGPEGGWAHWEEVVLLEVRLPRVLLAGLVGGGLALCGTLMQGVFRNPMADPGVLGVSAGAALGSVVALYAGWAARSALWLPALAFAGGLGCAFLVYAIATVRGRTSVGTLLLSGIAVGGIAIALTSFILSLALANFEVGRQIVVWLMGGLEGRGWLHLKLAAPLVLGGSLWAGLYGRELDALLTGEEGALSVGVDVPRVRRTLLVLATLVTSATVAVCGIVAFVGLAVPHLLRLLLGPGHRRLLPASFLGGAVFVILADLLSRTLLDHQEIRMGVITSLVGGPFFAFLLLRHRKEAELL